eukprot:275384_1
MPKVPHPAKQKLSSSDAVTKCLTFETPPATPDHMKKYRKKHNQRPGIKVIHHGLMDQKLPPSSHIYGIKLSTENAASSMPAVTKMFKEGHTTKLALYMKSKSEANYKGHQLGKSIGYGYKLPEFTNEEKFAFGSKSEISDGSAKELIEIDTNSKIPSTFSQMPLSESLKAQNEVVHKKDYHYNWNALNIDPKTHVFGKPPRIIKEEDKHKMESVANSLKFIADENEWNKPLNAPKQNPMPEDFIYGLIRQATNINEWGVKECIHTDVEEKKNVMERDLPENKICLEQIFGNKHRISSRIDPNRVTAGDLLNPEHSEMGIYSDELTKNRNVDEIVEIYEKIGYSVDKETISKIKTILAEKYNNICSLQNVSVVLDIIS